LQDLLHMISYLRNCKHCGLGAFHNQLKPIDFFCKKCWTILEREKARENFKIYKSPEILVKPLFLWKKKDSIVSSLIHGLKGGTPEDVVRKISLEITFRESRRKDLIIVPVPSSKVGERDHAYQIANIVSQELKVDLWNGLKWEAKSTNQKFLKKSERFENSMIKTSNLPKGKQVILIDDLVTTGATASAAFKAIKSLNQIEVWALACRM